jgi:hypothetical protein
MTQTSPISHRTFLLGAILAVIVAAVLAFCTGCKTTDSAGNPIPATNQAWLKLTSALVEQGVAAWVTYDLAAHPERSIAYGAALVELHALANDQAATPTQLYAVLGRLPITMFALVNVQSADAVRMVAGAAERGVAAGLNAPKLRGLQPPGKLTVIEPR